MSSEQIHECSKGWSDRCARSKGKRCTCRCGGHNHGTPNLSTIDTDDLTCAAFNVFGCEALCRLEEATGATECRWCQANLSNPTFGTEHSAGWDVPGIGTYWLYLVCGKCKYQWALWKLGLPRDWKPEP